MVAPLLGSYVGGIVYLGLIHASIPREPQGLENAEAGDQKITVSSSKVLLTPIATTPASTQPVPPPSDSVPVERF